MSKLVDAIMTKHTVVLPVAIKEVHCSCGWSRFPNNADTPYKVHQMEMLERAVRNEIAEAMHERGELEGSTEVCWAWEDAEAIARGGKEQ